MTTDNSARGATDALRARLIPYRVWFKTGDAGSGAQGGLDVGLPHILIRRWREPEIHVLTGSLTMRALKLLPDHFSYPLWDVDNPDNVDPSTLPLSEPTRARLEAWADAYDAILNQDDPASSGFPSEAAKRAFDEEGAQLWHDVSEELGGAYSVSYFSVVQRKLLPPPTQAV